jgi:hypothetical protein
MGTVESITGKLRRTRSDAGFRQKLTKGTEGEWLGEGIDTNFTNGHELK